MTSCCHPAQYWRCRAAEVTFLLLPFLPLSPLRADGPLRIEEKHAPGDLYRVTVRVRLGGELTLPPEKEKAAPQKLPIKGESAIDYDERILTVDPAGRVTKTIRNHQRMEFERTVGDQPQQSSLRPEVRRLVILRHKQVEVPFSPDGPLTWGEIDLVRTDVFTPALAGLLPDRPVKTGDRWAAGTSAIQELTDFTEIDGGGLACKLEEITLFNRRRHARVSFVGTVQGVNEDGKSKQRLEGSYYFDLESNHLSYLSMRGQHYLLDKDGKEVGKIEGDFVLTRQRVTTAAKLGDADLRGLVLEPNADNTLLLHDNPDLGVRFLHPRRWVVAGAKGQQLGLDERGGSGILLTVEPPQKVPTGDQYLKESQAWLQKQKAQVLRVEPVRLIQRSPRQVEQFALDVKVQGQQFRMLYFVVRQKEGGVAVAARLTLNDLANLQHEAQRIALSIELTRK